MGLGLSAGLAGSALATREAPVQVPQEVYLDEAETLKSEIYFGSDAVSQPAWEQFLAEVVVPRFSTGLTVVEALGRGQATATAPTPTRVLVVVHREGPDARAGLSDITAEYKKRFAAASVLRTDQSVRVRPE
jgi:hypothetical protein